MRAISLARFCCTGRRLSVIGSFFSHQAYVWVWEGGGWG